MLSYTISLYESIPRLILFNLSFNNFRHVSLRLGLRTAIPALTVNRLCGSGFQSIVNGVQDILVGDASVVLTGGSDNMSACPYAVRDIRFGTRLGSDPKLEDMMWASLTDLHCKTPMGVTAENLAEKYNLTRDEVDEFAIRYISIFEFFFVSFS